MNLSLSNALVLIALLSLLYIANSHAQLAVDPADGNYLTHNGVRKLFLCETPCLPDGTKAAKVCNFDLDYFDRADYVNHVFITLTDLYERAKWSSLVKCGSDIAYWTKLGRIAKAAHDHNVVLGICLFSYSVFGTSPYKNAFSSECTQCSGSVGPLVMGRGFFNYQSSSQVVAVQKTIMENVVKYTGMYDNVYYVGMWEVGSKRARAQSNWAGWNRWFVSAMKAHEVKYGSCKHLFAIEATPKSSVELSQWRDWGISFQVDEDANALKQTNFPLMMWSADGWLRGNIPEWPANPLWNADDADQLTGYCDRPDGKCEPIRNVDFMRWCVEEWGVAGVASSWVADEYERDMLRQLDAEYNHQQPPPKCPVERNCEQCHSNVIVNQ